VGSGGGLSAQEIAAKEAQEKELKAPQGRAAAQGENPLDKAPSRPSSNMESSDDSDSDSDSSDEETKHEDDDAAKKAAKKRMNAKKKKKAKKMAKKLLNRMIKKEQEKHSQSGYYEVPYQYTQIPATIPMINFIP
jgi:hypothetical protein